MPFLRDVISDIGDSELSVITLLGFVDDHGFNMVVFNLLLQKVTIDCHGIPY